MKNVAMSQLRDKYLNNLELLQAQHILTDVNQSIVSTHEVPEFDLLPLLSQDKINEKFMCLGQAKLDALMQTRKKFDYLIKLAESTIKEMELPAKIKPYNKMVVNLAVSQFGYGECEQKTDLVITKLLMANCKLPIYFIGIAGMQKYQSSSVFNHAFVVVGKSNITQIKANHYSLTDILTNNFSQDSFFIDAFLNVAGNINQYSSLNQEYLELYQMNKVIWLEDMRPMANHMADILNSSFLLANTMLKIINKISNPDKFSLQTDILNKTTMTTSGTNKILTYALSQLFKEHKPAVNNLVLNRENKLQIENLVHTLHRGG
jgi:hypothetical protein